MLKNPAVTAATLCEIDRSVVAFSREYLGFVSPRAFEDERTRIVIEDACEFITAKTQKITATDGVYKAILVDSTDREGPGEALFSERFDADCKKRLAPGGVMAVQAGPPFLQPDVLTTALERLSNVFAYARCYQACAPSYAGGVMTLGLASETRRSSSRRRRRSPATRSRSARPVIGAPTCTAPPSRFPNISKD